MLQKWDRLITVPVYPSNNDDVTTDG